MRFEVPQFIEIEDKIFGPFTWRQFVYLAGGAGMGVVTFIISPIIFALIGLPLAGLGFVLAFYPVNNRPFSIFLESIFSFYRANRIYHWRRKTDTIYRGKGNQFAPINTATTGDEKGGGAGNINSLSRKLELNAIQKDI